MIPAYNEADTIVSVLRDHDAVAGALGIEYEVLVVDDGSVDQTPALLAQLSIELKRLSCWSHPANLGIGRSLLDLYSRASGEWIYFNAADDQVPATELRKLWSARVGKAVVVGRRHPRRDPIVRLLVASCYSALVRARFGVPVRDVHSVKLYRSEALRANWPTTTSSFAEDEILIRMHRAGLAIVEVPIQHRPRRAGRAQGGSWPIVSAALGDLARAILRFKSQRR